MSDADLILPEPHTEEVTVVLAGLAVIQMQALGAGDLEKVGAAGNSMAKFAEGNPDQVRETLLENNQAFHVASMPDEMLDHLDFEVRDATLYENTDGDGWTEVEIDG